MRRGRGRGRRQRQTVRPRPGPSRPLVLLAAFGLVVAGVAAGGPPGGRRRLPAVTETAGASACPAPPPGPQFYAPPAAAKTVALTFDDGPGASTDAILRILRSFDVPATFMNVGREEATDPEAVVEEADGGWVLGSHTWDHADLVDLSAAAQAAELDRTTSEQEATTGVPPCVFRPPYGAYDGTTLALAAQRHLTVWMWSVDTEDWKADGSASAYWVQRIVSLAESEGGALTHPVVLMHDQPGGNPATVLALPTIIRFFASHGYRFVDLAGHAGAPITCGTAPQPSITGGAPSLRPGATLRPGGSARSPGGQFRLLMRRDGELLLQVGSHVLWATRTAGHPGASVVMQRDGNLVIYSARHRPLWQSGTGHHPGAGLWVQRDGRLAIRSSRGATLWQARAAPDTMLRAGQMLLTGWTLLSGDRRCLLTLDSRGAVVVKDDRGGVLWSSPTAGHPGDRAEMLADGSFVVRSAAGRVLWATPTGGHLHAWLELLGSARAVVDAAPAQPVWMSRP